MEQQTASLKQCISEVTKRQIVMDGNSFIYLDTKEVVSEATLQEATALKQQKDDALSRNYIKQNGEDYTLNGTTFKIPFMKDDADGLMQVKVAFEMGITDTVIHFSNGVKMPISSIDFEAFGLWFVNKRNAFFVG